MGRKDLPCAIQSNDVYKKIYLKIKAQVCASVFVSVELIVMEKKLFIPNWERIKNCVCMYTCKIEIPCWSGD